MCPGPSWGNCFCWGRGHSCFLCALASVFRAGILLSFYRDDQVAGLNAVKLRRLSQRWPELEQENDAMGTTRQELRMIMRLLAVPALVAVLAAGCAGLQLSPSAHAATSSVAHHGQLAETCLAGNGHC